MRYCPVCDARYDDETIKFCTRDGNPLLEVEQPNFVILPSDNEPQEFGEDTVIRRRSADETRAPEPDRIVIPAMPADEPRIRQREAYYAPPEPPNTGNV